MEGGGGKEAAHFGNYIIPGGQNESQKTWKNSCKDHDSRKLQRTKIDEIDKDLCYARGMIVRLAWLCHDRQLIFY